MGLSARPAGRCALFASSRTGCFLPKDTPAANRTNGAWRPTEKILRSICVVEVTVMELTIISAPSVVDQTTTSARLAINESAYDVSRDLISSHDTVSSVSPLTSLRSPTDRPTDRSASPLTLRPSRVPSQSTSPRRLRSTTRPSLSARWLPSWPSRAARSPPGAGMDRERLGR